MSGLPCLPSDSVGGTTLSVGVTRATTWGPVMFCARCTKGGAGRKAVVNRSRGAIGIHRGGVRCLGLKAKAEYEQRSQRQVRKTTKRHGKDPP